MIFRETAIGGVVVVEPQAMADERGLFARTWCADEFAANGVDPAVAQCSVSFNHRRHTLRGLHFQREPHGESKLVRCTRGAVFDVAVDLRPESPTYCRSVAVELTMDNRVALFVPPGCAHGFLTLADDVEVLYQISPRFEPSAAAGVRWDDPRFGIEWPAAPAVISERDATYPDFDG
ncbi:MAG TPA: dTDP-4-dehydrorhamnose 3,5-epimerase [Acidimicrobiales bacterium]|nr:dTDP-4-dehydrorhamnose 3,5-epimerase [Acidimicrobiales bacterium]